MHASCRAIERYNASLKEDEADEESMVGLAKTHLKRFVSTKELQSEGRFPTSLGGAKKTPLMLYTTSLGYGTEPCL